MPRFDLRPGDIVIPSDDIMQGDLLAIKGGKEYLVEEVDSDGDAGVTDELEERAFLINSRYDDDREIDRVLRNGVELPLERDLAERLDAMIEHLNTPPLQTRESIPVADLLEGYRTDGTDEQQIVESCEVLAHHALAGAAAARPGSYATLKEIADQFGAHHVHAAEVADGLEQLITNNVTDNPYLANALAVARAVFARLRDDTILPNIPTNV